MIKNIFSKIKKNSFVSLEYGYFIKNNRVVFILYTDILKIIIYIFILLDIFIYKNYI